MPQQQQFEQQQPLDLNTAISITLPVGAWNTVLGFIMEGPWRVADPIIQLMRTQIQQARGPRGPRPLDKDSY